MGIDFRVILRRLQRRPRRFLELLGHYITPGASKQDALDKQEAQEQLLRTTLFAAVGRALSIWAQTEESLVIIITILLRTQPTKAGIIMYSIINFNVWLGIADELAIDQSYTALKHKWNKINERLKKLNDTRVRLAHHTVYNISNNNFDYKSLKPGRFDTRGKSQKYPQPLDYDQISDFIRSLNVKDLLALINAMNAILASGLPEPLQVKIFHKNL
jgi:hypothetical protein